MKNSISNKDRFILILVFLPSLVGSIIHIFMSYNQELFGQWFISLIYAQQIMKNFSTFMIGVILTVVPDFFTKFLQRHLRLTDRQNVVLNLVFRAMGLLFIILSVMSTSFLVQEIRNQITIIYQARMPAPEDHEELIRKGEEFIEERTSKR